MENSQVSFTPTKNKSILFLINGLGIASKDSFQINYEEIMPNLTMLMNNYLSTSLENINYNYKNGFRNFSLGHDLLPTYNKLKTDSNLSTNQTITNIALDATNNHSKTHMFLFLDNDEVVSQTIKIIESLEPKGDFLIYLHIVLRQKDILEYDNLIKRIRNLSDKITLYKNVKIGSIVGGRKINSDLYYRLITKENGEKWPDYTRKLNYEREEGTIPRDINAFYLTPGLKIVPNDITLFLNYEDVDCDKFINQINYAKLYTLFPMKSYSYAINIYEEIKPTIYFCKTLEENNLKCLILTTEDRIPTINYNLNGLNEEKSKFIVYQSIKDKNLNIKEILNSNYDYIIFDYDISIFSELSTIKEFLIHIDERIGNIYNICDQSDYKLFITSLYGIYKDYIIGIDKQVKLDYSFEVPAIIVDRNIPKSKFSLVYGDTFTFSNTIFNLITSNPKIKTSINKKGFFSLFT